VALLGPGFASAAYDQGSQRQDQNQDRDQDDQSYQPQARTRQSQDRQPALSAQGQSRDMRLEQRIASTLRQQGFGEQGEIMILATGNRVILLGNVPDQRTKSGAEQATRQIASGQTVDNRLHVVARARRVPDSQLEKTITDRLPSGLSQDIQVQARDGTVTLQGQLDSWTQVADAIDAAFAAGASQVNSQFTVRGAGAMAREDAGDYPAYGYTPGQQRPRAPTARGPQEDMGRQTRGTPADLRLAQQVATQLRQQLPEQNIQLIQPQSIYVTVRQGTVTLHGYVQDSSQRQQAQQIVQSIQGVRNVRNDLSILSARGMAGQAGEPSERPEQGQRQDQSEWQGQTGQQQPGYGGMSRQGRSSAATAADRRLAQTIQQQLEDELPDANINVTASQGTVTLQGTVRSNSVKQEAEQIVQSVRGVQDVRNNLRVGSQGGFYPPQGYIPGQESPSQQGMGGQQGSKSQSQYGQSSGQQSQSQYGQSSRQQDFDSQSQYGQSGQMGGPQAGMSASDIALGQRIVQQLKQQLSAVQNIQVMRPDTIYIMAAQGTVMLHGFVQDRNISQQATQIARNIPGVRNVQSTLSLGGAAGQAFGFIPGEDQEDQQGADTSTQDAQRTPPTRQTGTREQAQAGTSQADLALAQQIAQRLRQQLTGIQNIQILRPGTIIVKVSGGTVTLDGFVPDNNTKQRAEQVAKSISGVQTVRNTLGISAGTGDDQAIGYIPPRSESRTQQDQDQQWEDQQEDQQDWNMDEDQFEEDQPNEDR
jgi:osmotically-inducible protein OsmY